MLIEFLGAAGNCADNLNYIGAKSLGRRRLIEYFFFVFLYSAISKLLLYQYCV